MNRRADGLHNLRSVMVPIALYDEIEIRDGDGAYHFECSLPELQSGNLVSKALRALGLLKPNLHVALRKQIPVGAGMGGGSSDAAAILLAAMNGELGSHEQTSYLHLARSLGSDVPFFLTQTAAIVEGTGERVTALGSIPPWHATIVRPPVTMATEQAYALLDVRSTESRARNSSVSLQLGEALQRAAFDEVTSLLSNDFQAVMVRKHPEIELARTLLQAWSGSPAILTGSGSCVFTLWNGLPPQNPLQLPPGFERFDAAFVQSAPWRSAS
ncbi:MAG: hypothetical protein M3N19_02055 [Candidatus Eremiobacteraeota bacterium]|nr:hypothetical protein [Candidatus Eremiobacteraeota bacterium]